MVNDCMALAVMGQASSSTVTIKLYWPVWPGAGVQQKVATGGWVPLRVIVAPAGRLLYVTVSTLLALGS